MLVWKSLALIVLTACGATGLGSEPTTTEVTAELPPKPQCEAYQGAGDFAELDVAGLCDLGVDLVPVVEACTTDGGSMDDCLTEAAGSDPRFDELSDTEVLLSYEAGTNRLQGGASGCFKRFLVVP